jgi:gas vesicle protein
MAERDEFGVFLIGFIIGGLTGAAISLLMAPQTGEETRGLIKDRAFELRDKAQDAAQNTAQQLSTSTSDVRARANELANKAKNEADDLRQRGQVMLEEQRNKLQNLRKSGPQDEETAI